jgi:cell division protein FtsB
MGELINFADWKKRKEDEAHEKEMEEIRQLQAELAAHMDEMEDIEPGPFISEEARDSWSSRALDVFSTVLDGYTHWPIDSSDM